MVEINWMYIGDSVPAFLTLLIIPLTYKCVSRLHFRCESDLFLAYSIAYGVIAGIISYIILNGIPLIIKKLSNGRIVPSEYKYSEKWVVPPGSIVPPFMYASIFFVLHCAMRIHASSAA